LGSGVLTNDEPGPDGGGAERGRPAAEAGPASSKAAAATASEQQASRIVRPQWSARMVVVESRSRFQPSLEIRKRSILERELISRQPFPNADGVLEIDIN
jgi:hypothetical protein